MENCVSGRYTCTAFWPLLLTPVSTELLPDICVARENKGYTGDIVQLSVTTGLFNMTAIPRNSLCPSRVTANRRSSAECCSCSWKRSGGWIHPRLCKFPANMLSHSHSSVLCFHSFSAALKYQLLNNCGDLFI